MPTINTTRNELKARLQQTFPQNVAQAAAHLAWELRPTADGAITVTVTVTGTQVQMTVSR